jgi:GTP-binding protein EngB required for normal cell division
MYMYPPAIISSCMHSCVHRPHPYRKLSCGLCTLSESSVQKIESESVSSVGLESTSSDEKLADGGTDCVEHGGKAESSTDFDNKEAALSNKENLTCPGCGAKFQSSNPEIRGFLPAAKLAELHELASDSIDQEDTESHSASTTASLIICQRCFSLKQYNTALNISLSSDDYLRYLGHLRDKDALILLMLDVSDFPGSVFPDLHTLISPGSQVVIVANKVDLIPRDVSKDFWRQFQKMLVRECKRLSLGDRDIARVHFVSAKTGLGVSELADDIIASWGSRGDVYLLGCTNAGKSTLFNRLLVYMCGVRPGELNRDRDDKMNSFVPKATISQWPGTTLGLLSFPIMSVGKRRRLMAQAEARKMQLALNPPGQLINLT